MIIKEVKRSGGKGSSFGRLARYVLEAKSAQAAILFTKTAEYILDTQQHGEKVASYRIVNCVSEEPAMAMVEIETTQAKNTRSKADKTFHAVIAFAPGETLSEAQLVAIEDRVCEALGYGEHQRISAVHHDTDHLHIHLAINKVHPETLRCFQPYYSHYKMDAVCAELEQQYGLVRTPRIGDKRQGHEAQDAEAHRGEVSLLGWIQETVRAAESDRLAAAVDWQAFHAVLWEHGLQIRPRGAGLVVVTADGSQGVKASSVAREWSMKSLTARFGDYQSPDATVLSETPRRTYQRQPKHPGATGLYAQYQQQRREALEHREAAQAALQEEHQAYLSKLNAWYNEQFTTAKAMRGLPRRERMKTLRVEKQNDLQQWRQAQAQQMKTLRDAHPLPTWPEFLTQQVLEGNTEALEVLRRLERRQTHVSAGVLEADTVAAAKQVVLKHLTPKVRRNGDLLYATQDGGLVRDGASAVRVDRESVGAAFLALSLAEARFGKAALKVEGTASFKAQVVALSVKQGFKVTFKDVALESQRKALLHGKSPSKSRHL